MTLRVSVVVPSYERPAMLQRCLAALAAQTLRGDAYEIVVVHDGPSDAAREVVAQYAAALAARSGPRVQFHAPAHRGPAAARNVGWRQARAEIIAFTDDDTVPDPGWLSAGLAALQPDVDAVWGRIEVPLRPCPSDYERDAAGLANARFVTANCFCRRAMLEQLGGFDERFRQAWREDSDLYFRLLDAGAKVAHAPSAIVVHPVRPAPWGVSLKQQRKVIYDALLFKKHRGHYRRMIRSLPRWDYYLIVATLVVAVAALVADAPRAAVAAAGLWLVLTVSFCVRRLLDTAKTLPHLAEMVVTSVLIPPLAVFWRLVGALRYRVVFL